MTLSLTCDPTITLNLTQWPQHDLELNRVTPTMTLNLTPPWPWAWHLTPQWPWTWHSDPTMTLSMTLWPYLQDGASQTHLVYVSNAIIYSGGQLVSDYVMFQKLQLQCCIQVRWLLTSHGYGNTPTIIFLCCHLLVTFWCVSQSNLLTKRVSATLKQRGKRYWQL